MIKPFDILDKTFFIDPESGTISEVKIAADFKLNAPINPSDYTFDDYITPSVCFCINVSNACNLSCDYCFNDSKDSSILSFEEISCFLMKMFVFFPEKQKYFVDLSGKGEPLLALSTVLKVNEFCIKKSNEMRKQILVSFVCNGTLLIPEVANVLQANGILFGVSLDGNKTNHDLHRKTFGNKGTFDSIIGNIKKIKFRDYIGCAVTITRNVFDIVETLNDLLQFFKTISIKPARTTKEAIDANSINEWLKEYDKLTQYLLECAKCKDLRLFFALLNGDDYFGKYMKRAFLGQKQIMRCDAGLSRFALDKNGKIFICPAASMFDELMIGNQAEIKKNKLYQYFSIHVQNPECEKCDFRFLCGGECLIERKIHSRNNPIMCKFKKHLILLSHYLVFSIRESSPLLFDEIHNFCQTVISRNFEDKNLLSFLEGHPSLSFMDGKRLYDQMKKQY